jgi:catechol 2,3-dioxygenase-like lactoylglutathione lyase family enzyme
MKGSVMTVPTAGRVQLALNVTDLEASIGFYSTLFGVSPHKVRSGYANFTIEEPPLKLVLIEDSDGGTINHLGVEVADSEAVDAAATRFDISGLTTEKEAEVTCCYALQDKVWVTGPDGERWEYYRVIADVDTSPARADSFDGTECCSDTTASSVLV